MKKLLILCTLSSSLYGMDRDICTLEFRIGEDHIKDANWHRNNILTPHPDNPFAVIEALAFAVVKDNNKDLCAFALSKATPNTNDLTDLLKKANSVEIAQILIDHGAQLDPLILHRRMGEDLDSIARGYYPIAPELIALLIKKGVSVFHQDLKGNTPLHMLAYHFKDKGQDKRLQSLLAHLVPQEIIKLYEIRNKKGKTALEKTQKPYRIPWIIENMEEVEKQAAENKKLLHETYNNALAHKSLK